MLQKVQEVNRLRAAAAESEATAISQIAVGHRRTTGAGREAHHLRQRRLGHGRERPGLRLRGPAAGLGTIPAVSLSAEPANITAIANDIGTEAIFARQLIAHARPEDVAVGISTSGGSANILAALAEARKTRAADGRHRGLRRGQDRRRAAGGSRGRRPLGLHPAHPGGPGLHLPRTSRARRTAQGLRPRIWNWRYRMRYVLLIVGGLMILVGGVWLLQGVGILPGSFMTGQTVLGRNGCDLSGRRRLAGPRRVSPELTPLRAGEDGPPVPHLG